MDENQPTATATASQNPEKGGLAQKGGKEARQTARAGGTLLSLAGGLYL